MIKSLIGPKLKLDSEQKIFGRHTHFGGHIGQNGQNGLFTPGGKKGLAPARREFLDDFSGRNHLFLPHIQNLERRFRVQRLNPIFSIFTLLGQWMGKGPLKV